MVNAEAGDRGEALEQSTDAAAGTASESTEHLGPITEPRGETIDNHSVHSALQHLGEAKRRKEWALLLLFLSSAVNLAWIALASAEGFVLINDSMTTAATIWNVIVAIGLINGGDGWRTFACFRAWLLERNALLAQAVGNGGIDGRHHTIPVAVPPVQGRRGGRTLVSNGSKPREQSEECDGQRGMHGLQQSRGGNEPAVSMRKPVSLSATGTDSGKAPGQTLPENLEFGGGLPLCHAGSQAAGHGEAVIISIGAICVVRQQAIDIVERHPELSIENNIKAAETRRRDTDHGVWLSGKPDGPAHNGRIGSRSGAATAGD